VIGGGKCVFCLHLFAIMVLFLGVFDTLLPYFWHFLRILNVKNKDRAKKYQHLSNKSIIFN
jgi:hypothetical protein